MLVYFDVGPRALSAYRGVRPKIVTASVTLGGLLPIMRSHGTGADVMKRIPALILGGVITSVTVVLLVYPSIYDIWRGWRLPKTAEAPLVPVKES